MRLNAFAAALMLISSTVVRAILRDDPGGVHTVADVLFWVSGVVLIAIAALALGRKLGVFGTEREPVADQEPVS